VTVDYVFLVFSLLLLWFPRGLLRYGQRFGAKPVRRTDAPPVERDPQDKSLRPLEEIAKSRNWVDFGRAAVGAYGLTTWAIMQTEAETGRAVAILHGGVLLAGMAIQMIRVQQGRVGLFAPIFFIQGVALGAAGFITGGLAMAGSWALSPVLPGAGAVLFVQGALAVCFGFLLGHVGTDTLMLLGAVTWTPVLASILLRKRLSAGFGKRVKIVSRSSKSAPTESPEVDADAED
jgi:hypothetical protein